VPFGPAARALVFAQQQALNAPAAGYRFAPPDASQLTIAKATKEVPAR
jgi:hypothetical protein